MEEERGKGVTEIQKSYGNDHTWNQDRGKGDVRISER